MKCTLSLTLLGIVPILLVLQSFVDAHDPGGAFAKIKPRTAPPHRQQLFSTRRREHLLSFYATMSNVRNLIRSETGWHRMRILVDYRYATQVTPNANGSFFH